MEYIIYQGKEFTIEWFYNPQGSSQALEYFQRISQREKIKLLYLVKKLGDYGEIKDKTKFRYEGKKIYALKPKPDRFLCFFFEDKKIVITNAFRKKKDKLPSNQQERAEKFREDYIIRVKRGDYYA